MNPKANTWHPWQGKNFERPAAPDPNTAEGKAEIARRKAQSDMAMSRPRKAARAARKAAEVKA